MSTPFPRFAVALVGLSLSLAGCDKGGGSAPAAASGSAPQAAAAPRPPPAASAPAACTLLSAEELKKFDISGDGKPGTSGGADVCTWMGANSKGAVVQVFGRASALPEMQKAFEDLHQQKAEPVSDLGDQAFHVAGPGRMHVANLGASKGSRAVSVQVMAMGGDAAKLKTEAIELTRSILTKL